MSDRIRATVRAAELLRSLAGTSGSPLQALMAFFEPILIDLKGRRYDPAEFATKVRNAYGWNFNEDVAEGFRDWLVRSRWLTPQRNAYGSIVFDDKGPHHVITPVEHKSYAFDDGPSIEARIDRITVAFRLFIKKIGIDEQRYKRSDDALLNVILSFLLDIGSESDPDPPVMDTELSRRGKTTDQDRYLIARFVQDCYASDLSLANDLQWIGSVGLLAELAEDFRKPKSRVKRSRLTVFIDSPVALDLLGTSGKNAAALTRSVIDRLQKVGVTVSMLDDSVRELQGTVGALLRADPFERYGPMQEAIVAGETDESFLDAVANDPASVLRPYRLLPRTRADDRLLASDGFFTDQHLAKLYAEFLSTYGDDASYERRCRHDANAAAYVMRLRKGHVDSDIFESSYIFLTRNRAITSIARQFAIKSDLIDSSCVGPFVNLHDMASSLWLRTGLSADEEIPRRQLMAGCERVLTRNQTVVSEARRAILTLRKEKGLDDEKLRRLEAILNQDRAMLLISDKVRGAGRAITSEDVSRIVDEFSHEQREAGIAIGIAQGSEEAAKQTKRLEEEKMQLENKLSTTIKSASEKIEETLSSFAVLEQRIKTLEAGDEQRIKRLFEDTNQALTSRRKALTLFLVVIVTLVLIVAVWKELSHGLPHPESGFATVLLDRRFLFFCGIIPVLAIFADNLLRILGLDRPIERFLFEEWSKKRLLKSADERGLKDHRLMENAVLLYSDGRITLAGSSFGMPDDRQSVE